MIVTKIYRQQSGMSLLEILLAILLFSISIFGFLKLQSVIEADIHHALKRFQAEQICFQILEAYPDTFPVLLPDNWTYQITTQQYNLSCKIVTVTIDPMIGETIIQSRWYCQ